MACTEVAEVTSLGSDAEFQLPSTHWQGKSFGGFVNVVKAHHFVSIRLIEQRPKQLMFMAWPERKAV